MKYNREREGDELSALMGEGEREMKECRAHLNTCRIFTWHRFKRALNKELLGP